MVYYYKFPQILFGSQCFRTFLTFPKYLLKSSTVFKTQLIIILLLNYYKQVAFFMYANIHMLVAELEYKYIWQKWLGIICVLQFAFFTHQVS